MWLFTDRGLWGVVRKTGEADLSLRAPHRVWDVMHGAQGVAARLRGAEGSDR